MLQVIDELPVEPCPDTEPMTDSQLDLGPRMFLACRHADGAELFVFLTPRQVYLADGDWADRTVTACEDRAGEMVPREVRLADLSDFEEQ